MTMTLIYQKGLSRQHIVLRHALAIHAHHPTNFSETSRPSRTETKNKKTDLANAKQVEQNKQSCHAHAPRHNNTFCKNKIGKTVPNANFHPSVNMTLLV